MSGGARSLENRPMRGRCIGPLASCRSIRHVSVAGRESAAATATTTAGTTGARAATGADTAAAASAASTSGAAAVARAHAARSTAATGAHAAAAASTASHAAAAAWTSIGTSAAAGTVATGAAGVGAYAAATGSGATAAMHGARTGAMAILGGRRVARDLAASRCVAMASAIEVGRGEGGWRSESQAQGKGQILRANPLHDVSPRWLTCMSWGNLSDQGCHATDGR